MLKFMLSSAVGCGASAVYHADAQSGDRAAQAAPSVPGAFDADSWKKFRYVSSKYETHDTRRFFFALPSADATMGLPLGSCILVDDKPVIRPYTPISSGATKGTFELMVKRYPKSKMGHHLHTLRPGEELEMKGPITKFEYKAGKYSHIGMIAGGTGVAPMFQIIQGVLDNPKDSSTRLSLVYSSKTRNDLLLAAELSEYQKTYKNFQLYLTLSQTAPFRWLGGVGHVNQAMLKPFMPAPGEKNTMILVCGPGSFMKAISGDKDFTGPVPKQGDVAGLLKEMGYKESQVYKF